jgi:hypothetical protein
VALIFEDIPQQSRLATIAYANDTNPHGIRTPPPPGPSRRRGKGA